MTPQNLSAPTNRACLLEARRLRNIFIPTAGGMEAGKEGGKEQGGGSEKGGRGQAFTFPDLMYCMWSTLGTNEKFNHGATTPVRLSSCRWSSNSHTHPSHSESSRFLTSSPSLGVPVPRPTQCMRGA